jgi:hypothetical protein
MAYYGQRYVREQGDTVLLEVSLVSVQHAVEPREELVGAVVGVQNDGATDEYLIRFLRPTDLAKSVHRTRI